MGGVWCTAKRTKRTSYDRNGGPVDREGCGVPQNGRNGPPTVETGVLFIGRGVAYRKTGLHGILFISTVDLLQPPRATVDLLQPPRAPVHPASTARYSTGYCSTTPPRAPLHRLLFIQPSTPRGPVQPPLHGHPSIVYCSSSPPHHGVLFNHPSTVYCSSSPPPHHGVLFIQRQRHRSLFIRPPPAMLTVHPIDRLQLAAVAKESLDRVQLTAINRSLGFSNA